MFYLRQHNNIALEKARLYGISKEKYVTQTPTYDNNYVTDSDTTVIKHATEELYALEMEDSTGLPEVFLSDLEESLPEGWI